MRCFATVFVKDDRWGGWVEQCDLPADHIGPHVIDRSACQPEAWMSWVGTYQTEKCPNASHAQGLVYDTEKDVAVCPICGHEQWEEMGG
jgi:hypothetical protein